MTLASIDVPTVAIVGGGFSGAAVAYHLAEARAPARILVYEPRELLGAGLAYADTDPAHRINVPANRMSLLPDDEAHFARWLDETGVLAEDPDAVSGSAAYPKRLAFGNYVDAMLRPFVQSADIVHVREAVTSVRRTDHGWRLRTASGAMADAHFLVVATTHPQPKVPPPLNRFLGDPLLIENALADHALDPVAPRDRVLIVGAGLTAADIVASLDARGHEGPITMMSRRGQRPRGHAPQAHPMEGDFVSAPVSRATTLVADIRRSVRQAVEQGRGWHPVLDAVRSQGDMIWNALEPDARRRIVRHIRPFWDAHRFRIAPQIEAVIDRKLADGSLEFLKAGLGRAERFPGGMEIDLIVRGRATNQRRIFAHVIVATGPAHGDVLRLQPYLKDLAETGAVALDGAGLGLNTARDGRAIRATGETEPRLFIAGPLARGAFGELMGLPQVSIYARFVADNLLAALPAAPVTTQGFGGSA